VEEGGVEALIWRLGGAGKGMDVKAGVAAVLAQPGVWVLLVPRGRVAGMQGLCVALRAFVVCAWLGECACVCVCLRTAWRGHVVM